MINIKKNSTRTINTQSLTVSLKNIYVNERLFLRRNWRMTTTVNEIRYRLKNKSKIVTNNIQIESFYIMKNILGHVVYFWFEYISPQNRRNLFERKKIMLPLGVTRTYLRPLGKRERLRLWIHWYEILMCFNF